MFQCKIERSFRLFWDVFSYAKLAVSAAVFLPRLKVLVRSDSCRKIVGIGEAIEGVVGRD